MTTETAQALSALRRSHDRLAALATELDASALNRPSYAADWTIAQVFSHLGSTAEVFGLLLDAGLTGGDAPGQDSFPPIWDVWNARTPQEQMTHCLAVDEAFVRRLEGLDAAQLDSFELSAFGMEIDASRLIRMRLSEHAVHTWDIAVALDPSATVAAESVELLVDGLPELAARVGKPTARPVTLRVSTTQPERSFALLTGGVRLDPWSDQRVEGELRLSAEELVRLVYGRLDPAHVTSARLDAPGTTLDDLRGVFPGI